ncbi:MAG: molybdate ABC transporter substrate-binding protein, partial [Proteobacteria bacterium]|nr:molybdate ABC transporter substrate-binding protein [Pseudomonadota bacterium]
MKHDPLFVIPAKAGIQRTWGTGATENWIPAYAGMTDKGERLRPLIAAIAIFAALFVSPARADEVRLFAASSTAPLFEAFSDVFEKKTGHTLLVVSASSAILANQIVAGADADIFVSANTPWKDHVRERISVWLGDLPPYMGNRLVLVTPKNADVPVAPLTPEGFSTLVRNGPFVLCETQSAPCGIYAKQALESLGLWDIAKKGKVIQGANARATLAWLERGEADAGIIYASDAKFSN